MLQQKRPENNTGTHTLYYAAAALQKTKKAIPVDGFPNKYCVNS